MSEAGSRQAHCWEQIDAIDPLYRITHVFVERENARRLLAVRALFASLERIVAEVKEEEVALRKLEWWRGALLRREPAGEFHPLIEALAADATLQRLERDDLNSLIDHACRRVAGAPAHDTEALFRFCVESGHLMAGLEHQAVSRIAPVKGVFETLKARRGLVQLLRESLAGKSDRVFWWVPLDLQARHGVSKRDFGGAERVSGVSNVFDDLNRSFSKVDIGNTEEKTDISELKQINRVFFSEDAVYRKKLGVMNKYSGIKFHSMWQRPKVGDLFSAWRAARGFNRQK